MGGHCLSSLLCLFSSFHATLTAHLCWWWGGPNSVPKMSKITLSSSCLKTSAQNIYFLPPPKITSNSHLPFMFLFIELSPILWSTLSFLPHSSVATAIVSNCHNQWCTFVCLCGACSPTKSKSCMRTKGLGSGSTAKSATSSIALGPKRCAVCSKYSK